jgi:hypothetical protein
VRRAHAKGRCPRVSPRDASGTFKNGFREPFLLLSGQVHESHVRLLQHHLGEEDRVRVAPLPGPALTGRWVGAPDDPGGA